MLYLLASIDTTQDCDAVMQAAAMVRAGLLSHTQGVVSDATPLFDTTVCEDITAHDVDTSASERDEPPAVAEDAPAEPDAPASGRKPRRKRADAAPEAPAVSHADMLDALHRITGTNGYKLSAEQAAEGGMFVRDLLNNRRPSDLKGRERAEVYAKAQAWPHQGVKEDLGGGGADEMSHLDLRRRA